MKEKKRRMRKMSDIQYICLYCNDEVGDYFDLEVHVIDYHIHEFIDVIMSRYTPDMIDLGFGDEVEDENR